MLLAAGLNACSHCGAPVLENQINDAPDTSEQSISGSGSQTYSSMYQPPMRPAGNLNIRGVIGVLLLLLSATPFILTFIFSYSVFAGHHSPPQTTQAIEIFLNHVSDLI
jgi:hypothetical protein